MPYCALGLNPHAPPFTASSSCLLSSLKMAHPVHTGASSSSSAIDALRAAREDALITEVASTLPSDQAEAKPDDPEAKESKRALEGGGPTPKLSRTQGSGAMPAPGEDPISYYPDQPPKATSTTIVDLEPSPVQEPEATETGRGPIASPPPPPAVGPIARRGGGQSSPLAGTHCLAAGSQLATAYVS